MQAIKVITNIDEAVIPGFDPATAIPVQDGISLVRIPCGTRQGNSTVAVVAPLPDGRFTFIEMTMNNFKLAAAVFAGAEDRALKTAQEN